MTSPILGRRGVTRVVGGRLSFLSAVALAEKAAPPGRWTRFFCDTLFPPAPEELLQADRLRLLAVRTARRALSEGRS